MTTIAHEFGHALGLWHEQTRIDRETVLTLNERYIETDMKDNYQMDDAYNTTYMGLPYDFGGIMHYEPDVGVL